MKKKWRKKNVGYVEFCRIVVWADKNKSICCEFVSIAFSGMNVFFYRLLIPLNVHICLTEFRVSNSREQILLKSMFPRISTCIKSYGSNANTHTQRDNPLYLLVTLPSFNLSVVFHCIKLKFDWIDHPNNLWNAQYNLYFIEF